MLKDWFDKLLNGIHDARIGDKAHWAAEIRQDLVQPGASQGYINIEVAGMYVNVDRLGSTTYLPVVTGDLTLMTADRSLHREIIQPTTEQLVKTDTGGYVLGRTMLAPSWVYSQSTLTLRLALVLVENSNLVQSTLQLVSDVVEQIPTASAALPILNIGQQVASVMNDILSIGEPKVRLGGTSSWNIDAARIAQPGLIIWVENPNKEQLQSDKFKWMNNDLYYDGNQVPGTYRASSWMVIELKYRQEYGDIKNHPLFNNGLIKIRDAIKSINDLNQKKEVAGQVLNSYDIEFILPSLLLTHADKALMRSLLIDEIRDQLHNPFGDLNVDRAGIVGGLPATTSPSGSVSTFTRDRKTASIDLTDLENALQFHQHLDPFYSHTQ